MFCTCCNPPALRRNLLLLLQVSTLNTLLSLLNFILFYIFNSPSLLSLLNFLLFCVSLPMFLFAGPFSEGESPSKSGESLNNATDVHLVLFSNAIQAFSSVPNSLCFMFQDHPLFLQVHIWYGGLQDNSTESDQLQALQISGENIRGCENCKCERWRQKKSFSNIAKSEVE